MNAFLKSGTGQNAAGYLIAQGVLKPFADLVNYLCFPTFLTIRAVAEGYLLERPVDFGAGGHVAFPVALEAVVYDLYRPAGLRPHVVCRGFLLRGMFQNLRFGRRFAHPRFFMIAMARFKAYQSVMELSYKLFRM